MTDPRDRLTAALSGRYTIERELGAGGMATVYLAHDVRHDRGVALKVLRPELAAVIGAERFLTEIKTTANLQHPHILALFDSGEVEGTVFYVMPFVEGESLRDRLTREKQLPVDAALRIAKEVASALDYAHRRGVIHRDIKPENILLHDGQALVADFGIALAASDATGSRRTETGISLGTPTYMSPEQALGERKLDARTDVYALGCVVYEMLAGEPPHTGPTVQSVVSKVMTDDARPLTELRKTVPAHVASAVGRALEKLPADRFGSAREFAEALERPDVTDRAARRSPTAEASRVSRSLSVTGILVALGMGMGLTAIGWFTGRSIESGIDRRQPSRLALLVPAIGGSGTGQMHRQLTFTPDGSSMLYMGGAGEKTRYGFLLQRLDAEAPTPIPSTELMYAPSISPDGRWLAVRNASGDLMRIPSSGPASPPVPIARGWALYAWHPDGSLVVTRPPYRTIERLPSGSDTLEPLVSGLDRGVFIEQILDDGQSALVVLGGAGTSSGPVALMDLKSGRRTALLDAAVPAARYAAGYLVYALPDGTLLAARFDPRHPGPVANPVTVATGVSMTGTGDAQFEVAANGTLAYVPEAPRSLVFVGRDGSERPATPDLHSFHMPRFSPDGQRISVDFVAAGGRDVWILDLGQKTLTRTTFDKDGHDASWAPDGKTLAYTSVHTGNLGVYRVRPGSSDSTEALIASPALNFTGEWLPDASGLVTVGIDLLEGGGYDIGIIRNGGKGPLEPLVATPFSETFPALSRDGRWLAFVSDQSGKAEVYVRPRDGPGDLVQISQGGGDEPLWSRDGRELFYRSRTDDDVRLAVARIETSPAVRVVDRRTLFGVTAYVSTTPHASYDVSPDGTYFAFVRRNAASRIIVVQNFPELVRREQGAGR